MLSDDYSPYCGLTYNEHNRVERAASAPHIVVSAPTRTGKTRRILAPAAILHPGPFVGVSSKPDLAELVITKRCMGVTGVIDLRPEQTEVWPDGVRRMVTDPTRTITDAHEALTVAETMLATSGVGFSGASGGNVAAGGLWETQAAPPLACLLYAASPLGNGQGMPWVLDAVQNFGMVDPNDENARRRGGRAVVADGIRVVRPAQAGRPAVLRDRGNGFTAARQHQNHRLQSRNALAATRFERRRERGPPERG